MKQQDFEKVISFMPKYRSLKLIAILSIFSYVMFIAIIFPFCIIGSSRETVIGMSVFAFVVTLLFICCIVLVLKQIKEEITISSNGIKISNKKKELEYLWNTIKSIEYYKENFWYGRQIIKIYLKESVKHNGQCDYAFDIRLVNKREIINLIPEYVWNKKSFIEFKYEIEKTDRDGSVSGNQVHKNDKE